MQPQRLYVSRRSHLAIPNHGDHGHPRQPKVKGQKPILLPRQRKARARIAGTRILVVAPKLDLIPTLTLMLQDPARTKGRHHKQHQGKQE